MKKWTKLFSLAIGIFMAIGAAVGIKQTAERVNAVENSLTLTFDVTSNPGGWPTSNSTTPTDYTYTLDDVDYTFILKNVKCNSGYLMFTQPAALGLPKIDGYKLSKVVAKNTGGCSTSVNVGISSSYSSADYISGGEAQKWATQSSNYTYTLSETAVNTVYYIYVTSKNAQITELTLTYEAPSTDPKITLSSSVNYLMVSGNSLTINAKIENFEGTLIWETSDSNIATVTNGVVTPVNYGKVTITARYGGLANDSINLVVYPDNSNTISIALALEICELTGNANSPYAYTVVGEVGEVTTGYSDQYHNISFKLIDENTDFITCYRAEGTHPVQEGTKIQITGNLINYTKEATVTPEFASGSTYKEFYTVTYMNDGVQYGEDVEVLEGGKLTKPTDPTKQNYTFVGWSDSNGDLWDFDNDTVNGDMILTSVWNSNIEAALQEDLNNIKPWMSLAYKYTDNMVNGSSQLRITDGDYYPHSGNGGISTDSSYSLTSDFANDDGLLVTLNTNTYNYLYIKDNKEVDEFRLYKTQEVVIEVNNGGAVSCVDVIDTSGSSISSKFEISYEKGKAHIKNDSDANIEKIAGFDVDFTSGGFSDVDFRIKMAIDDMSDLAKEHNVTEYGVEISDGTTTRNYPFGDSTRTSTDTNGTKQYMVIGLGDVFAHTERLQAVFSLKAYAVLNGKKLYSTNVKQHSVVSLVESYHDMSDYSDLVDSLYQYFVSVGLIDED